MTEEATAIDESAARRGRSLLYTVAYGLAAAVSWLTFATVLSCYPGTGYWKHDPPEHRATGMVEHCEHHGPVSRNGFGFWWQCRTTVTVDDGSTAEVTLTRSIVTPDDIGYPVELRVACPTDGRCSYGRPTARGWAIVAQIGQYVAYLPTVVLLFAAGLGLVSTIFGEGRARAVGRRLSEPRTPSWLAATRGRRVMLQRQARDGQHVAMTETRAEQDDRASEDRP